MNDSKILKIAEIGTGCLISTIEVEKVDFNEIYKIIDCDCIQVIKTHLVNEDFTPIMLVDESGKLKRKQVNVMATSIANIFDIIVGDVVLVKEDGEDLVPFTNEEMEKLLIMLEG